MSIEYFSFEMTPSDLVDGVKVADPAKYYKEVVVQADMNLTLEEELCENFHLLSFLLNIQNWL